MDNNQENTKIKVVHFRISEHSEHSQQKNTASDLKHSLLQSYLEINTQENNNNKNKAEKEQNQENTDKEGILNEKPIKYDVQQENDDNLQNIPEYYIPRTKSSQSETFWNDSSPFDVFYDQFTIPPDIQMAKLHEKAQIFGYVPNYTSTMMDGSVIHEGEAEDQQNEENTQTPQTDHTTKEDNFIKGISIDLPSQQDLYCACCKKPHNKIPIQFPIWYNVYHFFFNKQQYVLNKNIDTIFHNYGLGIPAFYQYTFFLITFWILIFLINAWFYMYLIFKVCFKKEGQCVYLLEFIPILSVSVVWQEYISVEMQILYMFLYCISILLIFGLQYMQFRFRKRIKHFLDYQDYKNTNQSLCFQIKHLPQNTDYEKLVKEFNEFLAGEVPGVQISSYLHIRNLSKVKRFYHKFHNQLNKCLKIQYQLKNNFNVLNGSLESNTLDNSTENQIQKDKRIQMIKNFEKQIQKLEQIRSKAIQKYIKNEEYDCRRVILCLDNKMNRNIAISLLCCNPETFNSYMTRENFGLSETRVFIYRLIASILSEVFQYFMGTVASVLQIIRIIQSSSMDSKFSITEQREITQSELNQNYFSPPPFRLEKYILILMRHVSVGFTLFLVAPQALFLVIISMTIVLYSSRFALYNQTRPRYYSFKLVKFTLIKYLTSSMCVFTIIMFIILVPFILYNKLPQNSGKKDGENPPAPKEEDQSELIFGQTLSIICFAQIAKMVYSCIRNDNKFLRKNWRSWEEISNRRKQQADQEMELAIKKKQQENNEDIKQEQITDRSNENKEQNNQDLFFQEKNESIQKQKSNTDTEIDNLEKMKHIICNIQNQNSYNYSNSFRTTGNRVNSYKIQTKNVYTRKQSKFVQRYTVLQYDDKIYELKILLQKYNQDFVQENETIQQQNNNS